MRIHYIILWLTALFLFSYPVTQAQDVRQQTPPPYRSSFSERLFVGGSFGLQFGSITLVDVSPMVGYRITDRLAVALGGTYQFYSENFNSYSYSTHIFGGRAWLRYYVFQNFFAHAEYELLSYEPYYPVFETDRVNVNSYLIGGGYTQWIGQKAFMSLMVLWNLNETNYSLYRNPIVRVGFGVGL